MSVVDPFRQHGILHLSMFFLVRLNLLLNRQSIKCVMNEPFWRDGSSLCCPLEGVLSCQTRGNFVFLLLERLSLPDSWLGVHERSSTGTSISKGSKFHLFTTTTTKKLITKNRICNIDSKMIEQTTEIFDPVLNCFRGLSVFDVLQGFVEQNVSGGRVVF